MTRQIQCRIVDQRVAQELAGFIVGRDVVIEVVRQVEAAGDNAQLLRKDFRSKPCFAQVQFVLTHQAGGKTIEQRESASLEIRRRSAEADDVGEEHRVLRHMRGEKQIG